MEQRELRARLTNELQKQRQNREQILNYSDNIISQQTKASVISNIDSAIMQIQDDIRKIDGNQRLI